MVTREKVGLTTQEALTQLHRDVQRTVDEYETSRKKRRFELWLKDALHHWSQYTTLCWSSALSLAFAAFSMITAYFACNQPRYGYLLFQGLLILVLVGVNVFLVIRDTWLRHSEIPQRIRRLLVKLKSASTSSRWESDNYPHLCSPLSPCITLQWTYRDGQLVNLPWALLVAGDVIVIRPGQHAPGQCEPLEKGDAPPLLTNQLYSPPGDAAESCSAPAARAPLKSTEYVLQETPYLVNLRLALEQALDRPVSYFNRQRYLLMITCVEHVLAPGVAAVALAVGFIRWQYLRGIFGSGDWSEMLLIQPLSTVLPLLPLVFPAAWLALDSFGLAKIQALLYNSTQAQTPNDPFDELEVNEPKVSANVSWRQLAGNFVDVWKGEGDIPSRSANLLHVLGSVTALCCVDKKGILSWPNPTAEKVFFLRNSDKMKKTDSTDSLDGGHGEPHQPGAASEEAEHEDAKSNDDSDGESTSRVVAEVLDLTHDHTSSFRLQFDDHAWRQHASSLKPLGLAILLNTCNMATQEHYTRFCSHVTCQAMCNEDLVPVINRRCLCELARQIGFMDSAKSIFKLEEQLSTFRHVQPEMVRRDIKFARSLSINSKVKFPFPHMVAVVVRDTAGGGLQLLSQGTADIVLDSCVEFWDGQDLYPFSAADRKKVQDFYQRTSLTAYCSAFAYRPLTSEVSNKLSSVYMELPADSGHLYIPHRSPTPLMWDCRNVIDPRSKGMQFHSTDSLLCSEMRDEVISDIQGCFETQCNQVFIGMVTMQYQAQIDMVQLIDQLERACIRFVHFSKENELRSRVFSEKMGLESGWNCHISLLAEKSERNRSDSPPPADMPAFTARRQLSSPSTSLPKWSTNRRRPGEGHDEDEGIHLIDRSAGNMGRSRALSFSAPSAINMEYAQVKFDEECEEQRSMHSPNAETEGWRSMSCLTDSTEQSAPVNFDMSNRAKLPRGIDKIRPHLEQIDNVPLLVSLFTDCTPEVTREMLHIMQEFGEVVCVIGSSANADNMNIFLQADVSFAMEPLYPQVCQTVPAYIPTAPHQGVSPIELSRSLNSVPCSLSFRREDPVSVYRLVAEGRHYMQGAWNCVQYWTCCAVAVTLLQLLATVAMLPPILTTGHVLWLMCLVVPLLSLSLAANPTDFRVMQRATGKNQCTVSKQMALFVFWCYGCKFLPSVLSQLLFHAASLASFSTTLAARDNATGFLMYPDAGGAALWGGWGRYEDSLYSVQHAVFFTITIHFAVISVSFVQRKYSLIDRPPFLNKAWMCAVAFILLLQAFYSSLLFTVWSEDGSDVLGVWDIPLHYVILQFAISPLLVFGVVELIKREEVKADIRFQKRERLDFDTKLGMNSPF